MRRRQSSSAQERAPLDTDDRVDDGCRQRPALTLGRVCLRFAVFALALVLADQAVSALLPRRDYADDWRMPRTMPTSELASFVHYVDAAAAADAGDRPIVAFVGASPTWGDAVKNEHATVPAWYRRTAEASSTPTRVYNFACNGQLLADEYFVANRVAPDADVVFVQLTYHAFNRRWRQDVAQRYPELPRLLGVPVDDSLARTVGCQSTPRFDVTGAVDRWLCEHWRLYGERDVLAARFLGSQPESSLFERWQRLVKPDFMGEEEVVPSGLPFDSLEPDEQMLIADEFASAGDYRLDRSDSEVTALKRLAEKLEATGTGAVFYISPINIGALRSYGLYDQKRYEENVRPLREIVESHGLTFIDLNTEASIPSSAFADINHTTEAGSRTVAQALWAETAELVKVAR